MAIDPGIVEDVLNVMQLLDVQHSIVGNVERRGISGGQRKRVNIGLLPWTLGGSNGAGWKAESLGVAMRTTHQRWQNGFVWK